MNTSVNATKKEWFGLLVLALPCMLYSMDLTVLNLALPSLSLDLKPSASQLLWIVDVYGFFLAGSLITMGTLGDRIGRRKILMLGGTVFALTSAVAAFSRSADMLICMRALQGVAAATIAPSTLSLIRVLFKNPRQRTFAIGLWGTSFSVGGIIGPFVGGLLIENFWWGAVFLINLPVMVLLWICGPRLLPEYKDPDSGVLDFLSAGLSLVGILLVIFGLKKVAEMGFAGLPIVSILLGIAVLTVFIRRQRTLKYPLLDLNLFKVRTFNALLLTNSLTMFVFFGTFIFVSQILQLVVNLSPLAAGLWSIPSSLGMMLSALTAPSLAQKFRPSSIMTVGLLVSAFGFFLLTKVHGPPDLLLLVIANVVCSIGCSPVLLFTTNMIVNSAPPEKAGAAAALSETGNEFGGALGIALLGSLGNFIYREKVTHTVVAAPEILKNLSTTLENALDVLKTLSADLSVGLELQVKAAFVEAFHSVTTVAIVILLSLVVIVMSFLRNVKLEDEHGD